jgi:hypothetical protein
MPQSTWNATEARQRWADLLDYAQSGDWQTIVAKRRKPLLVAAKSELVELLAKCCKFEPEVLYEDDGSVGVWLGELDVYGRGESLEEAAEDLIDSVREYVDDWDVLQNTPNHRNHIWHVRRVQLADDDDELCRVIFGDELAVDLCRRSCHA